MTRSARTHRILVAAGLTALAVAATQAVSAKDDDEVELAEARVFIEWNSTDTDYGVHVFWDGTPWKRMTLENEDGREVLDVRVKKNLRDQGLTEGFFESAEPPSSVLPLSKFLQRFPEGTYEFEGETLDGKELVGEAEFSHTLPAPPENLSPAEGDTVDADGFTVSFDEVTEDTDGNAIDVAYYEVVVEKKDDEPILQVFSVILRPSQTSVSVPAEFLEPETEYKFEVIAVLEGGNRTITESGTFTTDAED